MRLKEKFEIIDNNLFVATSDEHKFSTDCFVLANFANKIKSKDVVCDIGTGCGILSILIYKNYKPKKIYAIDILDSAIDLAKKSILKSNLSEKIEILKNDARNLGPEFNDRFDAVICNPPYKALNTGEISASRTNKITRHESTLSLYDVCNISYKILKFRGSLYLCQKTERLIETIVAMKKNFLEPKTLQFCSKNKFYKPWLFLIEARKKSNPFLKVLPTHFVEDN